MMQHESGSLLNLLYQYFGLFYFIIWNELYQIKRTEQHDLLILL